MRYTTQFLLSAMDAAQFPAPDVPEIAFLGLNECAPEALRQADAAARRDGVSAEQTLCLAKA